MVVGLTTCTVTYPCSSNLERTISGMLKLNRSWFPLARFLEDKFKWAEIVASTKEIRLVIEDNTVATAAGIRSLCDKVRVPKDSAVDGSDVEGELAIATVTS